MGVKALWGRKNDRKRRGVCLPAGRLDKPLRRYSPACFSMQSWQNKGLSRNSVDSQKENCI